MNQHYFSASPQGELRPREIEVELAGAPRTVVTAGGVFSPEQLDRGTAILLRQLPDTAALGVAPESPLLDVGCGWGAIALDAALAHPEREVWAIDVNERSRELTRSNAERLGLEHLHVAAPEDVPASLLFGEIRSNPPIRVGKDALHAILRQWLPRLAENGVAHLVVAKHLGADSLQRWIAAEFTDLDVARAGRDKGFHIIRARRA
ncbi:methyltransferase [Leucobacter sp. NPDC077196]|uniref:class I SAM-dependent methyltransferase n=1 Tax=Leucobacter sp. NPDC077196 TaxID=3154959 RepID=UPI00343FF407